MEVNPAGRFKYLLDFLTRIQAMQIENAGIQPLELQIIAYEAVRVPNDF